MPHARQFSSQIWSSGTPWMGSKHLGRSSVSGRRRVPLPAARRKAFISWTFYKLTIIFLVFRKSKTRAIGSSGHRVIGKPLEARSEKHLPRRSALLFCVALFPLPSGGNDFLQQRVFRFPVHFAHDALRTGTKYCR